MRKKRRITNNAPAPPVASSSSSGPRQIPGFYYDATKNRYFPLKSGEKPPETKNENTALEMEIDRTEPSTPPIFQMIRSQQMEMGTRLQIRRQIYANWKLNHDPANDKLSPYEITGITVDYLGDSHSRRVSLRTENHFLISARNRDFVFVGPTYDLTSGLTDSNEPDVVACVPSQLALFRINGATLKKLSIFVNGKDEYYQTIFGTPWRCKKPNGETALTNVAVTSDSTVYVTSLDTIQHRSGYSIDKYNVWKSANLKSDVFSLDYDDERSRILAGLRNGQVVSNDLRVRKPFHMVKPEKDPYTYEVYGSRNNPDSIFVARPSGIYLYDVRNPSNYVNFIYKQPKSSILPPHRLGFCVSPTEDVMLTGTEDGQVVLLDPWSTVPNSVIKTWHVSEDEPRPIRSIVWDDVRNEALATCNTTLKTLSFFK